MSASCVCETERGPTLFTTLYMLPFCRWTMVSQSILPLSRPSRYKRGRPCTERLVILVLLALAWSWIAAAIVIVYHGMSERSNIATASSPSITQQHDGESPLLIFTCRRAEYLQQTLTDVFRYLPSDCRIGCPVVISQDGHDAAVATLIHEFQYSNPTIPILHYTHEPETHLRKSPYQELAVHYGWALQKVFSELPSAQRVIVLEEDLHLSPDFFPYFQRMAPLLDSDQTLMAVSAFNDNGIEGQVRDASRVLRSDFFPGLGWCMTKRLWVEELANKWPDGYWDDWLREPAQRQGRHVLRPEVCVCVRVIVFVSKRGVESLLHVAIFLTTAFLDFSNISFRDRGWCKWQSVWQCTRTCAPQ